MHHQNLPPKPPSTHRAGSQSAASREGAEGLDPRRCPGRVLNSNPSPGTLAPFQVRHPGRSPTRLEAVHPVSQKEKPVGQDLVPLTPSTPAHLPRGCMQGREKSGEEKLEMRGDWIVVKLGKWRDTHRTDFAKPEMDRPAALGCPRRLDDEIEHITHGCINPFPSLADRARRGEVNSGPEENSPVNPAANRVPRTLGCSCCHELSDKCRHPPTHTIGQGGGDRPTSQ